MSVPDATGLRLALFSDTWAPQVNGVARTLARLVEAVRGHGGEATVFTADDPSAVADPSCVRFASIPFYAYPELRLAGPRRVTVDRALAGFRPTLVHAATPFGVGLAGRAAALRHGVPLVTSYHTSFAAYAAHYRLGALALPGWRFLRWFHNSGARTYCPSAAIVDEVRQHGFERLAVWSRGIDVSRFSPARRSVALRAQLGLGDDDVLVLYVGRLASEKGLGPALEGARLAAARAPWLRFAFVGDGPFAAAVRSGAPVGSWVPGTLTGDALAAAYASADLFLFPSTTDTFGNVLLEAAASGLPIVAADAGPTRELLAGSGSARLVPPHDPLGLAEALWGFGADAGARGRAGRAARGLAESRDWGQVWGRLFADYRTVLAPSAVRRAA